MDGLLLAIRVFRSCASPDLVEALCHTGVISQQVEEERRERRPPFAAFLCDEMMRTQLEKRAVRNDPSPNFDEAFPTTDKTLLAVARQRHAVFRGLLR